jgi:hypothetical protein
MLYINESLFMTCLGIFLYSSLKIVDSNCESILFSYIVYTNSTKDVYSLQQILAIVYMIT